jgi:polysaccharide biosynthesis transport protein
LPSFETTSDDHSAASGRPMVSDDSLASAVRRRLAVVTLCAALGLAAGVLYLVLVPKRYVAVSSLLVEPNALSAPADDAVEAQIDIIKSSEVLRLADRDGSLGALKTFSRLNDPVPAVKRGLDVDVTPRRNVINVSFAAADRSDAVKVVDLVVEAYLTYQSEQRQQRAKDLGQAAEASRGKLREQLAVARQALAEFEATNNLAASGMTTARAASIADAATQAQLDTFTARRAYDDAVAAAGTALAGLDDKALESALSASAVSAPESAEMLAQEVAALDRQLGELRKTYAANHPSIVRASQRLQQLRLTQVAGARQRWLAAQAREASLAKNLDAVQKEVALNATKLAERDRLADEAKRVQSQVDEVDRQISQIALTSTASGLNIKVDSLAEIDNPGFPPLPRPTPTLATTGLIGLVLGGLFALIGEYRHTGTLRHVTRGAAAMPSATDAGETLGMKVLGEVPEADEELTSPQAIALAAQDDPFGVMGNAVRSMRVAMEVEGKLPATILLTAASDKQGTTTLAVNLATTIAKENRKVLLVDLNFASPRVAQLLSVDGSRGLAELLGGGDPIDLIRPSNVARLDVLPTGTAPADAAALLNSEHFMRLLGMLSAAYDHVIFDAPSLARGDDARIVASVCDGTVLVARRSLSAIRRAAGARDLLLTIGANLLGVALNRGSDSTGASKLTSNGAITGNDDAATDSPEHGKGRK